jgi:nucleoside-diphosphate-sugar epimerase
MSRTVLIVGASGVVGHSAVEAFLAEADHEVISVSRRRPDIAGGRPFRHISADLRDADACRDAFGSLGEVTHVVYAALYEKPGLIAGWSERDQMQANLAMLRNVMEPLSAAGPDLRHVSLLQGAKAYGIHLHPMPIPARERAPRDDHANFYWLQEDYLQAKADERGFDVTILRPQLIVGAPYGVAMNLAPIIGAYAAVCREEGEPFAFPGGVSYVWEAVDARLVAKALTWAARSPQAAGQHFNITNGDVFEWRNLWPAMAATLGVETGPDRPRSLAEYLPAKAAVWDRIVARHGLRPVPMRELVGESHHYADFCFAHGAATPPPPAFVSTVKLREAGFCDVRDTEDTFTFWLNDLIARRILPAG